MLQLRKTVKSGLTALFIMGLSSGPASAIDGSGTGAQKYKYKVQRCGSMRGLETITAFSMTDSGTWSLTAAGMTSTGTYTEVKANRKFNLSFDATSLLALISELETDGDSLCELVPGSASVVSSNVDKFTAKTNKRQNRIKAKLKLSGVGTDGLVTGKVRYGVKAVINFTPTASPL